MKKIKSKSQTDNNLKMEYIEAIYMIFPFSYRQACIQDYLIHVNDN